MIRTPYEASLTDDDVREIQHELGLEDGDVTGKLDQKTRAAVAQNQSDRSLTSSGELNSDYVGDLLRKRRTAGSAHFPA